MSERVVLGGICLAVLSSAVVTWLTGSMAVLGQTPVGIAIYLLVGVAGPQYVLARRRDDPVGLGVAVLAGVGALAALLGGFALGDVHREWGVGVTFLLAVVVFGVLAGAVVRAFRDGYRSAPT